MKLQELIDSEKNRLLSIYCTAGFPHIDSLPQIINACEEAGVDFMEIGIPYSDPLCDGPTIQRSSAIALDNGMKLEVLFDQLMQVRTAMPLIMMGYFNVVLQFGIERFCQQCKQAGVEAVIIPDLPLEVYKEQYQETFNKYDVQLVFLVSPQTSDDRIRELDELQSPFIYAVSSSTTTGASTGIFGAKTYLQRLKQMELKHPFMIGFNIANADDVNFASRYGRGAIIGSTFINQLRGSKDLRSSIIKYIESLSVE